MRVHMLAAALMGLPSRRAPLQDTRIVLGLSLAAALNRPLGDSRFGVFRL